MTKRNEHEHEHNFISLWVLHSPEDIKRFKDDCDEIKVACINYKNAVKANKIIEVVVDHKKRIATFS